MSTSVWIAIVLGLVVLFAVGQYNRLKRLNVSVDEAFAQIEVQLQRRGDLIPNLVETVKGYASHEREALEAVVAARAAATAAHGVADVAAADGSLTNALRGLLAVSEAYPDLKASANFISLQEELSSTENKVGFARQYYNDGVRKLNEAISTIPGNLFTGIANVSAREFYVVDDPAKREVPKVEF
jgi:LemA protein